MTAYAHWVKNKHKFSSEEYETYAKLNFNEEIIKPSYNVYCNWWDMASQDGAPTSMIDFIDWAAANITAMDAFKDPNNQFKFEKISKDSFSFKFLGQDATTDTDDYYWWDNYSRGPSDAKNGIMTIQEYRDTLTSRLNTLASDDYWPLPGGGNLYAEADPKEIADKLRLSACNVGFWIDSLRIQIDMVSNENSKRNNEMQKELKMAQQDIALSGNLMKTFTRTYGGISANIR
jgi:hypothetical protein